MHRTVLLLALGIVVNTASAGLPFKIPFLNAPKQDEQVQPAEKAAPKPDQEPYVAVSYSKITGQLTGLLPGDVRETVDNIAVAAIRSKLHLTTRKTDGITATIEGKLSDNRMFYINLTGKSLHDTIINLRVAPKGFVDPKVVGGDEASARMILQVIRREAGLKADGRRKKFIWF